MAKDVVRNSITCFRAAPRFQKYLMGNLPFTQYVPVFNKGVNYTGPFLMSMSFYKISKINKIIYLFIYLFSDKVAVTQLDTKSFIATLKRFIGRRGKPKNIYSDNAGTFIWDL